MHLLVFLVRKLALLAMLNLLVLHVVEFGHLAVKRGPVPEMLLANLKMQATTKLSSSMHFARIEHLSESCERFLRVSNWLFAGLFTKQFLKSYQLGAIKKDIGNVDLTTDEVSELAFGVEQWRQPHQIHEGGSIPTTDRY